MINGHVDFVVLIRHVDVFQWTINLFAVMRKIFETNEAGHGLLSVSLIEDRLRCGVFEKNWTSISLFIKNINL